jgi:3'-phosphoadenosine 5'-phosphosulfate sulfotransferase
MTEEQKAEELQELKETLAQTIENDEVAYETLKLHDQEEIGMLNSKVTKLENKIADIKANCDLAIEGRDIKIMELEEENNKLLDVINNQDVKIADLEQQIEKMKNCGNCKYGYCGGSSISIDKDGNRTSHNWNEEKQAYCDVGKNGKYQCWELEEND